jgi:hypothetical protein
MGLVDIVKEMDKPKLAGLKIKMIPRVSSG